MSKGGVECEKRNMGEGEQVYSRDFGNNIFEL